MHLIRIVFRIGCAAVCAAAMAACSATVDASLPNLPAALPSRPGNPSQPVNFHAAGVTIRDDDDWTLPLDSYDSARNWQITDTAINALAQQCMIKEGLTTPAAFKLSGHPGIPVEAFYGVLKMSSAKASGYRVLPGAARGAAPGAIGSVSAAASGLAISRAYFGDPQRGRTGCRADAANQIGMQKAYDAYGLVQNLRSQARAAAWRDPRVQRANAAWSSCMKAAGYNYPDPVAPAHDKGLLGRGLKVPPGAQLPPPSPAEKAAAVADVTCKRKGNFTITLALVTASYQNLLISQNSTALRQGGEAWRLAVKMAQKINANGS